MKISYALQLKDFFILFLIGIGIGIIYGILNMCQKIKPIYAIQIILDIVFCIISTIVFLFSINIINMGEFRLFLLIAYIIGFIIERITLGKLFAKGYKFVYNKLIVLGKQIVNSKFGRIIFK